MIKVSSIERLYTYGHGQEVQPCFGTKKSSADDLRV